MRIIDETNVHLYDQQAGNGFGLIPRDYGRVPLGAMPYTKPFAADNQIIDESEWADRIKAMQGAFIRHLYTGTPEEDYQNGLNYCWAASLMQALKGVRDSQGQPKLDLQFTALGRDVNFSNAGNYCGDAIKCAAEYGFCLTSFAPDRLSLSPSSWKEGWQEDAKLHRPKEWRELGHVDMRRETISALLLGKGVYVGLNRFRHAVWYDEAQIVNGKLAVHTPNTHGPGQDWVLAGSLWVPDEAYVLETAIWSND